MKLKVNSGGKSSSGIAGKIFLTLFLGLFLAAGVFFAWMMLKDIERTLAARSWPRAKCTILKSDVSIKDDKDSPYCLEVTYEYVVDGQKLTSRAFRRGGSSYSDCSKAWRVKRRYDAGVETACFVNPDDPKEAVLSPGSFWSIFGLLLPGIFILVGGGGIYLVWSLASKEKKRHGKKSISEEASSSTKPGLIVFGAFFIVGGIMTYFLGAKPMLKIILSKGWSEVPCTVESSRVRSHSSDDGTTYSVDICYRYMFDGEVYKSSRYVFMGGSSSGYKGKKKIVDRYRKGTKAVCYVDPRDPFEAVLNRGLSPIYLVALIPLLFFAIGLFGLIFISRKSRGGSNGAGEDTPPWLPEVKHESATGGEIVLKGASRWGKFIAITIFAVIWNSFVVFMLVLRSKGEGPPILFPIVFGGVGVLVIGGVFHSLLAVFNPRPIVTLSVADVIPGQDFDLGWRFSGATGRISSLRITLELREEATYTRGTNSYTDKNVLESADIVSLIDKREFGSGACTVSIPVGAMHSFQSPNNKLIWAVKLHGDIRFWPDVSEEYIIRVSPGPHHE